MLNRVGIGAGVVLLIALAVFAANRYSEAERVQQDLAEEEADHLNTRTRLDEQATRLQQANTRIEELEELLKDEGLRTQAFEQLASISRAINDKLTLCIGGFTILTEEMRAAQGMSDFIAVERRTGEVQGFCSQALREQMELEEFLRDLGVSA